MSTAGNCPISVYIIAKNEADRIGRAIGSVIEWADEVVVVDSGSEDETVSIAARAGARVLHNDWAGYGPQKRMAEEQCRNDWLLMLDADEEVSPGLAAEIQQRFRTCPQEKAFRIKVTDLLPGEDRPKWFAYSYRIIRLYHRGHGRCSAHAYKDRIEMQSPQIGTLRRQIWHRSFRSWHANTAKLNFFTTEAAEARAEEGIALLTLRLFTVFPCRFIQCYLGRRFILRGATGLAMSLTLAYLSLLRLLKVEEQQRRTPPRTSRAGAAVRPSG